MSWKELTPITKYGNFVVLMDDVPKPTVKAKAKYALVVCVCGKKVVMPSTDIRRERSKSCGCLPLPQRTHGLSRHPLRCMRVNMIYRCGNSKAPGFNDYGGRGISVCAEWEDDFFAFYNWALKNGWMTGLVIDRINNDGNYSPENCRFVTVMINARNKRNNIWIEYEGQRKILKDWAIHFGVGYSHLRYIVRIKGLTLSEAIKSILK